MPPPGQIDSNSSGSACPFVLKSGHRQNVVVVAEGDSRETSLVSAASKNRSASSHDKQDERKAGGPKKTAWEQHVANIVDRYFSRKKEYWPVFADPAFAPIVEFRSKHYPEDERVHKYPNGAALQEQLLQEDAVPHESMSPPKNTGTGLDPLLSCVAALSKEWENPASTDNIGPMPSDPALYGSLLGTIANPNLVCRRACGLAADLEAAVSRQVSSLVGYDPTLSTGVFTPGGTFCNLYGYLLGIRKNLPETKENGLGGAREYRVINSSAGHYSNITNLSLLGINIREKVIRVEVNPNNQMDLQDLERNLRHCFQENYIVPTIMLTMGTTDTFGVDDVGAVVDLRNKFCEEFELKYRPHIHVDAAIGWPIVFFLKYDFEENPLGIPAEALAGIKQNAELFKGLRLADSFTMDFHKWGYVPYTSSVVLIKDKDDMDHLESDPELFSYFEEDLRAQSHLQSTIECSRGASGVFGAYTGLKYLGVVGYQTMVANSIDNANYFRARLAELGCVKLIAADNKGPSVGFRIYDTKIVDCPDHEFEMECKLERTDEHRARVKRNTDYHRSLFLERKKGGLIPIWIESAAHTVHDDRGRFMRIPGERIVFLNPRTTHKDIDVYMNNLKKQLS